MAKRRVFLQVNFFSNCNNVNFLQTGSHHQSVTSDIRVPRNKPEMQRLLILPMHSLF